MCEVYALEVDPKNCSVDKAVHAARYPEATIIAYSVEFQLPKSRSTTKSPLS